MTRYEVLLVVALTSPAALAAPCITPTPISTPRISVQLSTVPGSFRLHYENSFAGYAAQFGAPVVSIDGANITISQPVVDAADAGQLGAPAPSAICDSEDVDLGTLGAGVHRVAFLYPLIVAGVSHGLRGGGGAGFILDTNGTVQCSTTRSFSLAPSLLIAGAPVTVTSTIMTLGSYLGTDVARTDDSFVVTDTTDTEFPTEYVPYCLTTSAPLGALGTGNYVVQWKLNDFGAPRPEAGGTLSFTVIPRGRRRASAH